MTLTPFIDLSLAETLAFYNDLYALHSQRHPFPYAQECLLYALYRQASQGDCCKAAPSKKNRVDFHKHAVWKALKGMPCAEAELLFKHQLSYLHQQLTELTEP
ncbi:MAG: acyl-CoA-binding protein [Thiotrichales bacterium]|nr:acyl-CoA-binding protein [Thiotrichales bacterium]